MDCSILETQQSHRILKPNVIEGCIAWSYISLPHAKDNGIYAHTFFRDCSCCIHIRKKHVDNWFIVSDICSSDAIELTIAASYLFNVITAVTKVMANIVTKALSIITMALLFLARYAAAIIIQSSTRPCNRQRSFLSLTIHTCSPCVHANRGCMCK